LHLINDLSVGGAEMMLYRLLSQTRRDRFDSVVLSLMDQGSLRQRIEDLGIPVYTARMKAGMATPASIWRLIRLVRKIKPDLIQGWLYHGSLAAQLAGMFASAKAPVIWGIHSTYSLPLEKKLTAAIVKLCAPLSRLSSSIVFVSRSSQSQHKAKGYFSGNSCVIPNGIDTTLFAPSNKARVSVRAELGLSTDALLVGVIGRHHPMKDQANFLRAAGQISKRYGEAHFLLAGRSVDVDNRTLLKLIEELKLDDHVHLLGERTDIVRLVAALDIFCLSSCYGESFPVIVGEAMSCAVPCVVTDVGDSAWMVSDTGRFVPPRDTGALAAACEEFLDIGPAGRQAMGAAARSRVNELFSLPSVVAKYEELYENSIATVAMIGKAGEMAYQSLSGVSTDKNA
jgi:glycosyltransferase involved in cell wall biosynthesis